jgi:hypothetical protein
MEIKYSILGHANRKTTEIYFHPIAGAKGLAMDFFERAGENSNTKEKKYFQKRLTR